MSKPSEPDHEPTPSNMTLSLMEQDQKLSSGDINPVIPNMDGTSAEEYIRQIFGDVGFLINDFSCSMRKGILMRGRIYLTNKYICFYSNTMGIEKKLRIPYSKVKSIDKSNTMFFTPNAITVKTEKADYVLKSFWDREECYKLLTATLAEFRKEGIVRLESIRSLTAMSESAPSQPPTFTQRCLWCFVGGNREVKKDVSMYTRKTPQPQKKN